MKKKTIFFLIIILLCNIIPSTPHAKAEIVDINPSDDSSVTTGTPELEKLLVGTHGTGAVDISRTLLKFDLSSIPSGSTITDVVIYIYCFAVIGNRDLQIYSVDDDSWNEDTVNWGNQPLHISLLYQFTKPLTTGWRTYSNTGIDEFVIDEFDNDQIVTFKIMIDPETTGTFHRDVYYSKEYDSLDPYLKVTYTVPQLLTEFFGAGFNSSSPYVELHWTWNYTYRDFFEIQNSSDGESWEYLGQSTTTNYTDTLVVNGTERYYRVRACNNTNGGWDNSTFSDVNFEIVYFIPEIGDEEIVYQNVTGAWLKYNATSINVVIGTYDAGFLNSTYFKGDSNIYNVTETTGTPAWNIEYNFTGLPTDESSMICLCVDHWLYYDGNAQHDIWFEVYNYTSSSWVEIGILQDMTEFGWKNYTVQCIPTDLIDNGNVRARIMHDDLGNINHHIYFDYIVLKVFIPSDVVVSGGINSSGIIIVIFLFLIAITLVYGVSRKK